MSEFDSIPDTCSGQVGGTSWAGDPPLGGVPDVVSTRVVLKCSSHPSVTATNTSFASRTPRSLRDLFPLRGVEVATSGGRLLELARTRRARVCFQAQSSEQAMIRLRLCAPLARAPTPEPHVVRLIPKKTRYFSCFFHFFKDVLVPPGPPIAGGGSFRNCLLRSM